MDGHCRCNHDHCHEKESSPKESTYPLTMENLEKGVKNINTIIDMIDTRQDENREQMIIFLKLFVEDLGTRLKNKDKPIELKKEDTKLKEPEMPVMERINKSLIQLLQLKPAVMLKYGNEFLDKIWEISDELNNYLIPEDLLSQQFDKRLTPLELMKFFLQLMFGGGNKIEDILKDKFIVIDQEKRKITINEEEIKKIVEAPDKYINDNNLLCNLMLIKIFSYTKTEVFYTGITSLFITVENRVIKFYKALSLYAFSLWNLNNKKEELIKSFLYILGGILKDFNRSLLKTEKLNLNNLAFFKPKEKEEHYFEPIELPEQSVILLKKCLLLILVNFISVYISGYDANKPYDIQDGNNWDEYSGLILRLKDPKLTEIEKDEIPRMIPLSLDMKCIIISFISDILFFFCTHYTYVKDSKLTTDFEHFDTFKYFTKYMILNSNYNILVFFQKNLLYQKFIECSVEKLEYEVKDNFNTYGLFFIFFSLIQEKQIPLIINKKAYAYTMTEYLKIILKEAKDFGIPNKKEDIMKYFINELKKRKMIDLEDDELKRFCE